MTGAIIWSVACFSNSMLAYGQLARFTRQQEGFNHKMEGNKEMRFPTLEHKEAPMHMHICPATHMAGDVGRSVLPALAGVEARLSQALQLRAGR